MFDLCARTQAVCRRTYSGPARTWARARGSQRTRNGRHYESAASANRLAVFQNHSFFEWKRVASGVKRPRWKPSSAHCAETAFGVNNVPTAPLRREIIIKKKEKKKTGTFSNCFCRDRCLSVPLCVCVCLCACEL